MLIARIQQQIDHRHQHERHGDARQQQAVAFHAAIAPRHGDHQQHAPRRTHERRQRQAEGTDELAQVKHHQHRPQGRPRADAQQMRVRQGVTGNGLQRSADQCQAGPHQGPKQHPGGTDQPDDMGLALGPRPRHVDAQLLGNDPCNVGQRHRRGAKCQGDQARHQQQCAQHHDQPAIRRRAVPGPHRAAPCSGLGCKASASFSIASAFSTEGVTSR
ncbi:hypothetical protein D3C81_721190 [compost metagenome]